MSGRPGADPGLDARVGERRAGERVRAHDRVLDGLLEAPGDQLGLRRVAQRVAGRCCRHPVGDQVLDGRFDVALGRPRREVDVDLVVVGPAAGVGVEPRVGRPRGLAERLGSAATARRYSNDIASQFSQPVHGYRPCGAAWASGCLALERCRRRCTRRTCSAAALRAPSTIVHLEQAALAGARRARPGRRCIANAACMPAVGSHGPRWMRGWSHGWPVTHARPVTCSIVWAKPTLSRHGPESPNAGMRTRMQRGLTAVDRAPSRGRSCRTPGARSSR